MSGWVGRRLAGFHLVEELGAGSMTTVFRAEDPSGRTLVLKLFHPFLRDNPRLLGRFRRESKLLARLDHPAIVRFRGYYEEGEALFYVMDRLEAETVEALLARRGGLPPETARRIARDMAAALAYAHENSIIHRDLKPSNLYHDEPSGRTVLADFGLAKSMLEAPITAAGTKMMGTPHYMAPEQVQGEETSKATDIYQAGLLCYELLTGERPFQNDNPFLAIMARCERDLPLEDGPGAALSPAWKALLRRACHRDPQGRFPGAAELHRALEELTAGGPAG